MSILAVNKRARYDYEILETLQAGLALLGHEVKSAKLGQVSLKGSYVTIRNNEAYLLNAHIAAYRFASPLVSLDPVRTRKLLLKKSEIKKLIGKQKEKGLSLIPIKLYTKKNLIKLEYGVGKGMKKSDKSERSKKRKTNNNIRREMSVRRR